jgi:transposase
MTPYMSALLVSRFSRIDICLKNAILFPGPSGEKNATEGGAAELSKRRRHALRLLDQGLSFHEVARRGPVIVLWDNASIHKGPLIRRLCQRVSRLHLEPLPAYAPELNADEGVWGLTEAELANGRPTDLIELEWALRRSLRALRRSPTKLRGCLLQTQLSLFP